MTNIKKNVELVEASLSVPFNILKRYNVTINGKRTSVTIEPRVWDILKGICEDEGVTINELCTLIKKRMHDNSSLSSSIRVFLISYLYAKIEYSR